MKIIISGIGSAGLLTAAIMKYKMPDNDIIILDGGEGVIGVGESTVGTFINDIMIHAGVKINDFIKDVKPVAKYGIEFDFGEKKFHYTFDKTFNWKGYKDKLPIGFNFKGGNFGNSQFSKNMITKSHHDVIGRSHGVHVNNKRFISFLTKHVKELGVNIIKEDVNTIERDGQTIKSINNKYKADYYIDCTGFNAKLTRSKWIPYKSLINDRALLFMTKNEHPIKPYTLATTMNSGWLWQIDHIDSTNNGYVYSSKYITDDQAKKEIENKINKKIESRLVKFKTGRREKQWESNVISIGNSGSFIEPLESTSLNIITNTSIILTDIFNSGVNDYLINRFNSTINERLDNIADFVSLHFILNKKLNTSYWKDYNKVKIKENTLAYNIIEYYKHNDTNIVMTSNFFSELNPFGLEGWYSILRGLNA
jgi:tryptophan 7-halogenase